MDALANFSLVARTSRVTGRGCPWADYGAPMRAPRRRHAVKPSTESPLSSPSSAVLLGPRTRSRVRSAASAAASHSRTRAAVVAPPPSSINTTQAMSHLDVSSPPASPQSSDHQYSADSYASPLSDERRTPTVSSHATAAAAGATRRRRKRVAIELPPDQASHLNKDELKKLKNRIAAARARERTQKQVEELEATVEQLWRENQEQQALIDHLRSVIQQSHHAGPSYLHAPASTHSIAPPVSYQAMLSSDPHGLLPSFATPMDIGAQNSPVTASSSAVVDAVHAGLLAEFREMFPTSSDATRSPHDAYFQ